MIPQLQVQQTILTAQLKAADMTLSNITALQGGQLYVSWSAINKAQQGINSVERQYNFGDLSSVGFLSAYACLESFVGTYGGGDIDPNAQVPNTIIEVVEGGSEPPIPIVITAGVTPTPLTVTYNQSLYPYPDYVLIRKSDGSVDWNTNVIPIYAPVSGSASFIIEGATADGTTWADDYTFIIKP